MAICGEKRTDSCVYRRVKKTSRGRARELFSQISNVRHVSLLRAFLRPFQTSTRKGRLKSWLEWQLGQLRGSKNLCLAKKNNHNRRKSLSDCPYAVMDGMSFTVDKSPHLQRADVCARKLFLSPR